MCVYRSLILQHKKKTGTVYCDRYHYGSTVLIGDAGHAITPFFGQGTNSGFESVAVLTNRMRRHSKDISRAFREYTSRRKADTDAIAQLALENFVEMREKVGDDTFLRRKKIENALENRFPKRFRSRYSMVCYGGAGGVSYSAAYALGEIQWRIVCELDDDDSSESLNWSKADELIRRRLDPVRESMGVDLTTISHDTGVRSRL